MVHRSRVAALAAIPLLVETPLVYVLSNSVAVRRS